jgi:protein disulfide-isomerase
MLQANSALQNHRYWDTTSTGEAIRPSRTSILETIAKITKNPSSIASKSTSGAFTTFLRGIHSFFTGHWFLGLGVVVGIIVAATLFGRRKRRAYGGSPGYFQVGEKSGFLGGVGGLGKND